jgi:hypothetical protein
MPKAAAISWQVSGPCPEPGRVRERLEDALVVHRQHRPDQPFTPHRHLRLRLRRIPGCRLHLRIPRARGDLRAGGVAAVRSQHPFDPPAGDRPLLPFLLCRGQLGRDAVGLLPQLVDSTASGELVPFQYSDDRRHPRPLRESPTLCLTSENATPSFGTTTATHKLDSLPPTAQGAGIRDPDTCPPQRRLARDYETLPARSKAMIQLAMASLTARLLTGETATF